MPRISKTLHNGSRACLEISGNNLTNDRFIQNGGYNPPREITFSADMKF